VSTADQAREAFVPGRSCAACTLCCTVLTIATLNKPANTPCPHCALNIGCTIYDARPAECGAFHCAWLFVPDIDEKWRPAESGMVLHFDDAMGRMQVHVDPDRPDAWRREPYHAHLRAWAAASVPTGGQVTVFVGYKVIAILPDRDKELGEVRPGQMLVGQQVLRDGVWDFDAQVVEARNNGVP
jgi:hypothetical protein